LNRYKKLGQDKTSSNNQNNFFLNKMIDENQNEYSEALNCLKSRFLKHFAYKGFRGSDKFDKNVWFLQKRLNLFFSSEAITPKGEEKNIMLDILEKCSSNGLDINKLDIKVEDFVNEISKIIYEYHDHKVTIEKYISRLKLKNKIEEIKFLRDAKVINIRKRKNSSENYLDKNSKTINLKRNENDKIKKSSIEFYFSEINGLNEGEYKITLCFKLDSQEDFFTNKKATIFLINPINKKLEKQIRLDLILKNSFEDNFDKKIFSIKEYCFEIEKNSKLIFTTESVSFDPFIIENIDQIYRNSQMKIFSQENFSIDSEYENPNKFSIKYDVVVNLDNEFRENILKKVIEHYDNLLRSVQELEIKNQTLLNYFDRNFSAEINETLKNSGNQICASCCLSF